MKEQQTETSGLTDLQVRQSRNENGSNRIEKTQKNPALSIIRDLLGEPMNILLLVASGIYFITGSIGDGIFMLGAIILISAISIYQDRKSSSALKQLQNLTEPKAQVRRNGILFNIPVEELVPGDLMVIEEGNRIAADGRIMLSHDFAVDESILTGESLSVNKSTENPELFQGTLALGGRAEVIVTATGSHTKLASIGLSLEDINHESTPLQLQITHFVKRMAILGIVVFSFVWFFNFFKTGLWLDSLLKALTLAMSILPEEIPVAFTTFMALGAWRLSKMGIIVKRTQTIEALGSATVICTDKTGTITENKMTLTRLYMRKSEQSMDLTEPLTEAAKELIEIAMWASEPVPFDPMEMALHESYRSFAFQDLRTSYHLVHEYPLDGKPPMMTHIFENNDGNRIIAAKGAPEALIAVSNLSATEQKAIQEQLLTMAQQGYRVLGVGVANIHSGPWPTRQQDFTFDFLGLVSFYDPPKPNIGPVIKAFYEAGIKVKIITGDNPYTTKNIAQQIGITDFDNLVTGDELLSMDELAFERSVSQTTIFARMFPEAKLRVIQCLKKQGEVVAMTGDGVNDGPALKAAHIGVAMGLKGTEIAKEASSLILIDDDLARLVDAVAMGRKIYLTLKNAIRYIISIHIPIILTVFIPLVAGWIYPNIFSPVHVIFFELIMGPTCSIIYENEPMEKNLLQQKPRPLTASFFKTRELTISILQGIVIALGMLLVYQLAVAQGCTESETRAMVFISLIMANISLTLINRSFLYPIWETILYKNNLVTLIIGITVLSTLLLFLIDPLRQFFQLAIPTSVQILQSLTIGILATFWFEMMKMYYRRAGDKQDR